MKKRSLVIAFLLVLLMSFVFIGCGDDTTTTTTTDDLSDAKAKLADWGYNGDFPEPNGCTFDQFVASVDGEGDENFAVSWTGGSAAEADAYKAAWEAKARDVQFTNNGGTVELTDHIDIVIMFASTGGTMEGYTVEDNTIILIASYYE